MLLNFAFNFNLHRYTEVKEMRQEIAATHIPYYLGHFEKMLQRSEYLAGDKVTIADAQFLTTVRWLTSGNLDHIPADCADAFPKIKAFQAGAVTRPVFQLNVSTFRGICWLASVCQ